MSRKQPQFAIDIIEKAKNYSLLSKTYLEKPINIGNRKKLIEVLLNVDPDMVIATYGSSKRCIIILDYTLGELMDIIHSKRYES